MAKPDQDLKTRITEWLETQGYPVEMTVARAFRKRRFRIHQSHFFIDPNTSKSREIDVLVTRQGDINDRTIRVAFVIECKKSPDPWVIFTDSSIRLANTSHMDQRAASPFGKKLLSAFATDPLFSETGLFRFRSDQGMRLQLLSLEMLVGAKTGPMVRSRRSLRLPVHSRNSSIRLP